MSVSSTYTYALYVINLCHIRQKNHISTYEKYLALVEQICHFIYDLLFNLDNNTMQCYCSLSMNKESRFREPCEYPSVIQLLSTVAWLRLGLSASKRRISSCATLLWQSLLRYRRNNSHWILHTNQYEISC